MERLNIRSNSWGDASISWSVVIEELLFAMENMNHNVHFISTNGYNGMKRWTSQKGLQNEIKHKEFISKNNKYDIDITYTIPQNFPQRFLTNSKCKMAIYAYESSIMPKRWSEFYKYVDFVLPHSKYVADMMINNGCPEDKIKVVNLGVDLDIFNPNIQPFNLETTKSFKFLCVAEPHYRKQLDKLLEVYCKTFTSKDDVCFVLKTKLFKPGERISAQEIDIMKVLLNLKQKYGSSMPEIKIVSKRIPNIASLYTACNAFVLMTASEGWGVPYLEALATGLPVIAPNHGGQLEFLNNSNSILTKCGIRKARIGEQYWGFDVDAVVGNPDENDYAQAMRKVYEDLVYNTNNVEYASIKQKGLETAQTLTWVRAANQILDIHRDFVNA